MAKLEIQIQIRKTVKPSTPTPDHLRSLKLSFFDQMNVRNGYVPVLVYYLPSPNSRAENTDQRCDKLQKSLADALAKFYPLAGRFNKDDLLVNCNDEGVEYVETKVNADLAAFLFHHEDGPKIEHLHTLLRWENFPKDGPLLGIQVNLFTCGGLVIGIQISHTLADAFTIATFINEWASCCSLTGITEGCPSNFGLLSSLYPPLALPLQEQPTDGGAKLVTRRFVFDALAIAKLKDTIDSSMKPSRVVVIISLIWKVLVGISSATHGHSRESFAVTLVNLRKRTNISSLEHALGNFAWVSLAAANQSRKEFIDFVSLVGSVLRDTFVNFDQKSPADLLDMCKVLQRDSSDIYYFTSWSRFPFYEADFGWGKPFWVSTDLRKASCEGAYLYDTNDGEGIEAWVRLKEKDMAAFERDPDILAFCPSGKLQLITQVDYSSWLK